jgi:hypothetical protein
VKLPALVLSPRAGERERAELAARTGTPVVLATGGRNAALGELDTALCVLWSAGQPLDLDFLHAAARLLGERERLWFVTSFGARVPVPGEPAATPVDERSILARPLHSHVPTVFRRTLWERLGGFDEQLPAGVDPDFWLRALADHAAGVVLDGALPGGAPWDEAPGDWRPFLERHGRCIERVGAAALLAKEAVFRELERRARVLHG